MRVGVQVFSLGRAPFPSQRLYEAFHERCLPLRLDMIDDEGETDYNTILTQDPLDAEQFGGSSCFGCHLPIWPLCRHSRRIG